MPSLPSPEPKVSCFDDLDFFKDFENEFPAIVYNDTQTSKSNLLTELILSLYLYDEFDLNDKTSLSKYDEEEQNVLYFNDYSPLHYSSRVSIYEYAVSTLRTEYLKFYNLFTILSDFADMTPLPLHDQRHIWIRYQVEGYTKEIVHDFEQWLETIFGRQEMAEDGFGAYWLGSERLIPDKGDLRGMHLKRQTLKAGSRGLAWFSGGLFIRRLAHHFGLVSDDGLRGLSVVARELSLIEMGELVKLNICMEIGDDWAWADLAPIQAPLQATTPPLAGLGLCYDFRDSRRRCRGYDRMSGLYGDFGQTFQAFDETYGGAYLQHSSDAPGRGTGVPQAAFHAQQDLQQSYP
ncbi:hypothetical protein Tco_1103577 [Tanacetum coccineum]